MRYSQYFIPTLRETKEESMSFDLSLRAGLINPLSAGIYSYLPLGLRVLRKVEAVIRRHMNEAGALEVLLPALHPIEIWQKTGRDEVIGEVMLRIKDRRDRTLVLGPTHEEIITDLVAKFVSSYKQLPVTLYQIQTKFRDEIRPKGGLIRASEFIMKDAYSFDADQESLDRDYEKMFAAYRRIFDECGLRYVAAEADTGFIGGSVSHEFLAPAESGEDAVYYLAQEDRYGTEKELKDHPGAQRKNALELGHIFQLGTKYSQAMGAFFQDKDGTRKPVIMGCYGIGVSRIISAVIEQNNDADGIVWPRGIAPFDAEVICLQSDDAQMLAYADNLYRTLTGAGLDVLFDERTTVSGGVKFKDARLIGVPVTVVVGKKNFAAGTVEVEIRATGEKTVVQKDDISRIVSMIR